MNALIFDQYIRIQMCIFITLYKLILRFSTEIILSFHSLNALSSGGYLYHSIAYKCLRGLMDKASAS